MAANYQKLIIGTVFVTLLSVFIMVSILTSDHNVYPEQIVLSLSVAITSGYYIISALVAKRPALLAFNFSTYTLFFVAPLTQLATVWDPIFQLRGSVNYGFLLVLSFIFTANFIASRRTQNTAQWATASRPIMSLVKITLLVIVLQLLFILSTASVLFTDRTTYDTYLGSRLPLPIYLIFNTFIRPTLLLIPVFALISFVRHRHIFASVLSASAVILGLAINNPMTEARIHFGSLAVGLIMIILGPRRVGILLILLIAGVLASPLFQIFRVEDASGDLGFAATLDAFRHIDFDAFSMVVYGIEHVRTQGTVALMNLVSALFFFIPRSLWSGKLEQTGTYIASDTIPTYREIYNDNISFPLVAEGYVALSLPGVLLVASALGLLLRTLDSVYVPIALSKRIQDPWVVFLSLSPVLIVFTNRGALMSAFAYSVATALSALVSVWATSRRRPLVSTNTTGIAVRGSDRRRIRWKVAGRDLA